MSDDENQSVSSIDSEPPDPDTIPCGADEDEEEEIFGGPVKEDDDDEEKDEDDEPENNEDDDTPSTLFAKYKNKCYAVPILAEDEDSPGVVRYSNDVISVKDGEQLHDLVSGKRKTWHPYTALDPRAVVVVRSRVEDDDAMHYFWMILLDVPDSEDTYDNLILRQIPKFQVDAMQRGHAKDINMKTSNLLKYTPSAKNFNPSLNNFAEVRGTDIPKSAIIKPVVKKRPEPASVESDAANGDSDPVPKPKPKPKSKPEPVMPKPVPKPSPKQSPTVKPEPEPKSKKPLVNTQSFWSGLKTSASADAEKQPGKVTTKAPPLVRPLPPARPPPPESSDDDWRPPKKRPSDPPPPVMKKQALRASCKTSEHIYRETFDFVVNNNATEVTLQLPTNVSVKSGKAVVDYIVE